MLDLEEESYRSPGLSVYFWVNIGGWHRHVAIGHRPHHSLRSTVLLLPAWCPDIIYLHGYQKYIFKFFPNQKQIDSGLLEIIVSHIFLVLVIFLLFWRTGCNLAELHSEFEPL